MGGCGAEAYLKYRRADDEPVGPVWEGEGEAEPISLLGVVSKGEAYGKDDKYGSGEVVAF